MICMKTVYYKPMFFVWSLKGSILPSAYITGNYSFSVTAYLVGPSKLDTQLNSFLKFLVLVLIIGVLLV